MKNFNLDRVNFEKIRMGEAPISLKRISYPDVTVKDGHLVDLEGNLVGTKGDMYTKILMDKILENGCIDHNPRPYYEDFYVNAKYDSSKRIVSTSDGEEIYLGERDKLLYEGDGIKVLTPAHTLSINSPLECSYDLSRGESPMITLRPIAIKSSIAEILWIYQKESNDLVEFDKLLGKCTWDQDHTIHNWWKDWALKDHSGNYLLNGAGHPTIGSCYGKTVRRRHILKNEVIDAIKKNPDGRRNIVSLWQTDDFLESHGLKPCAFLSIWNVRHEWDGKDYLDMKLVQRSSDFATAGCINQVQYAALLKMVSQDLGMEAGIFTWSPVNVQIYDRHIEQTIEMLNRDPATCRSEIVCDERIRKFDEFTPDSVTIEDYPRELIKKKNPQLKFPLGI